MWSRSLVLRIAHGLGRMGTQENNPWPRTIRWKQLMSFLTDLSSMGWVHFDPEMLVSRELSYFVPRKFLYHIQAISKDEIWLYIMPYFLIHLGQIWGIWGGRDSDTLTTEQAERVHCSLLQAYVWQWKLGCHCFYSLSGASLLHLWLSWMGCPWVQGEKWSLLLYK